MAGLETLDAWLAGLAVTRAAMESTGVHWKPVVNALSSHLELWIVNARDMKQVPGRKTDVCDAEWSHGPFHLDCSLPPPGQS